MDGLHLQILAPANGASFVGDQLVQLVGVLDVFSLITISI